MSNTGLERDPTFLAEAWALYGVGAVALALRFAVRLKTVGFRGLQMDDLFAAVAFVMYTYDAVMVHLVYILGTNVEASGFQLQRKLTPQEVERYTLGSKLQLMAWYSYTALLWSWKGTMLFFFRRMTTRLWQARLVRWLLWACLGSYLVVVLTKNWQVVPSPGPNCTFREQNIVVTVILNVLTDAAILFVPLPLLWTLQVPWKKKLVVGLLMCSGFFVITASIIRVALTLGESPSGVTMNRWGVRETAVGVVSVNVPILRPLFTATFWTGPKNPSAASLSSSLSPCPRDGGRPRPRPRAAAATPSGPYEMMDGGGGGGEGGFRKTASHDSILGADKALGHDIYVETVYQVETEDACQAPGTEGWSPGDRTSRAGAHGATDAV